MGKRAYSDPAGVFRRALGLSLLAFAVLVGTFVLYVVSEKEIDRANEARRAEGAGSWQGRRRQGLKFLVPGVGARWLAVGPR